MVACCTLLLLGEDAGCGICARCLRCGDADRSIMLLERPHRSRGEPRSPPPSSSPNSTSRSFRRSVAICSCCCRLREDDSGVRRCKKKGDKRSGVVRIASFSVSAGGGGGGGGGEEDRILDIALLLACPASAAHTIDYARLLVLLACSLTNKNKPILAFLSSLCSRLPPSFVPPPCPTLPSNRYGKWLPETDGLLLQSIILFTCMVWLPCGLLHD